MRTRTAAALLGVAIALGAGIDLVTAATARPEPAVVRTDYTTSPCRRRPVTAPKPSHKPVPPGRRSTWHCHPHKAAQ